MKRHGAAGGGGGEAPRGVGEGDDGGAPSSDVGEGGGDGTAAVEKGDAEEKIDGDGDDGPRGASPRGGSTGVSAW